MKTLLRQSGAGLRMLLVLSELLGVLYPLAVTAIAQVPGLRGPADGSMISVGGRTAGSELIGQSFTDARTVVRCRNTCRSRPSAGGYDPTATGASNLGPESVIDAPGSPSLLTQVCARNLAVGRLDGVDGSRPYCTPSGVGAVLAVSYASPGYQGAITRVVSVNQPCPTVPFVRTYRGVVVTCARPGASFAAGRTVLIRGSAPAHPAVPADAVTASGSGVDPDISPAYARIQEARVARVRQVSTAEVHSVVARYSTGRFLGFFGEPVVNVLQVDLALDRLYPVR